MSLQRGDPQEVCLLGEFELNVTDAHDITKFGGKSVVGGLVINEGAVHASRVLYKPLPIAVPEARVLRRDEVIGYLYSIGRATSNACLRLQIEVCSWHNVAGATINDDKMPKYWGYLCIRTGANRRCFAQVTRNGDDHLHKKEVEQNN